MTYKNPLIYVFGIFYFCCACSQENQYEFPYQNPDLPVSERVDDLVSRMTLEQKVSQMVNESVAIDEFGIPAYNWWNEGLHGMARAGIATVFPQAIGMAASWNTDLIFDVATAISDETRAKHHDFVRKEKRYLYQGLTLWSPNINIFRDPRWGRGQETYGEDPFLSGSLAVPFIKGLQGDDPEYFKTIATIKHFAVHSGPEPERHEFDAKVSLKDIRETYLPQFKMAIEQAHPYSAMCAYNRLNGEACCGSEWLLQTTLKDELGFDGFIVSDCFAITDIWEFHKITDSEAEASALAVKSGTDLSCGNEYLSLVEAVAKGYITEEEIDVSVKRLLTARFRLGMFDPIEKVKYAQIPYEVVDQDSHRKLALQTARESMVLLKNDNQTLPLSKDLHNIAVIGPNSDQWLMLLGNYNGVPSEAITPLQGIKDKVGNGTKVEFAQGSEYADGLPMFYTIEKSAIKGRIQAEFFDNSKLKGNPLFTEEFANIDINWSDRAPRKDMDDDDFGVRWKGELIANKTGYHQIGVITTCNTQLYFEGELAAKTSYHFRDEYGDPRLVHGESIWLEKGQTYSFRVDAGETYADAMVQLVWAEPKPDLEKEAIEVAKDADVIVMFMGLTPRMEGEEMDIQVDGFRGGDRTKLGLPETQLKLIKSMHALGKPVVLVLLNGSAIAVNWENEHIPAILEAWYPGQAGGAAIADILFGDYNPSGKLPITFYKSEKDLPDFTDYTMSNQTYRFFKGEALYPFGHGLSYTSFDFADLKTNSKVKVGQSLDLEVTLHNTGEKDGEEVIQVYVSDQNRKSDDPIKNLVAYQKVSLKSGDKKTVKLKIDKSAFQTFDKDFNYVNLPGEFEISIGNSSTTDNLRTSIKIE
ncbi:glycoside hydrolase family 3 C-terminal domain-containing protein [Belliella kenyensis]|uniref:Glycoside hydrolase family 3 C-terminal domain-containing protein n=1 Tax=Belliella kenyensis TaxID=1472724 RepID=A0ABV8EFL8_9BACT|nr:glycoside hydrolase family 3 C-terminal domain-containing protein [Belliella kenyensis]MCH7401868.1 glycoside hydrolase family 3 C-terminal domain-containing protein [Belliella kenyensis]MDN3604368.1 glycoside hydrolase family 3 C-terminal domain-containing protein [Belliella kenyensis]